MDKLTKLERDVLGMAAEGFTNQEIAERRGVAMATVKNQTQIINIKIGARNRYHAVAMFIRWQCAQEGNR